MELISGSPVGVEDALLKFLSLSENKTLLHEWVCKALTDCMGTGVLVKRHVSLIALCGALAQAHLHTNSVELR